MGPYLSIDETFLSDDELYTIVTNKEAKGRKGSIVAIVRGTKAEDVIEVLLRIKKGLRHKVKEGEFYQFNLSSCIRQQNSLTAQFVSFSLSNLANIFYPPNFYNN